MASNSISALQLHLHRLVQGLPPSLRQSNSNARVAALIVTALGLSIPALSYAVSSYRGYLALGRGGVPYNVFGWALQGLLQILATRDTRDPSPFTKPKNRRSTEPHGSKTFFDRPIPERGGDRPTVPGYVAPQRQTTQRPSDVEVMTKRMRAYLDGLLIHNTGILVLKPSKLEGVGTPAVFLDTSSGTTELPGFMRGLKGETAHVHPECSSHITLSMADAEEVVRKGWAERHRLSGVGPLPWSYVLIYAPRDDEEFEVWKGIMKAGLRFVCTGAGRDLVTDGV
ncbi:hypothetical protein N0V93_001821 [Gnomoniopsis smithogilvyi]|uniref:Luciferase domain-containing protein n=1 Tax=Gnomoniopsis smithogilvyi TaxID=1191159 RepID=A0A9W8Z688_9PEZI|nr:hypothetical protein N0V93_001821 [Gnomoniopsis smithogilvyi]